MPWSRPTCVIPSRKMWHIELQVLSCILGSSLVSRSPISRPSYQLQWHIIKNTLRRKRAVADGKRLKRQLTLQDRNRERRMRGDNYVFKLDMSCMFFPAQRPAWLCFFFCGMTLYDILFSFAGACCVFRGHRPGSALPNLLYIMKND